MYDAGANFSNVVLWTGSTQKQIITDIYAYAPEDRNVGGVNIKQIEQTWQYWHRVKQIYSTKLNFVR